MIALLLSLFVSASMTLPANAKHPAVFLVCKDQKIALTIFEEAMNKRPATVQLAVQGGICRSFPNSSLRPDWRAVATKITPTVTDFEGDRIAVFEYNEKGKLIYLFILNPDEGVDA